jgi:hypothetical protein
MTPLRTLVSRSTAGLTRRSVLKAGAWMAGIELARQGLGDAVFEGGKAAYEAVAGEPDTTPHMQMKLGWGDFERLASEGQKAAMEAWKVSGLPDVPEVAQGRCTRILCARGEAWIEHQGHEAGSILWGAPHRPGIKMADQPDQGYGRWRAATMELMAGRTEAKFELVRAVVKGRKHRYTALLLPIGKRVTSVTADDPAMLPPAPRSTAPTTGLVSV